MIKLGDLDFTSIKQGSTDIIAVYLADEMIWGGSQPSVGGVVTLTLTGGTTSSVTYSDGIVPNSAFTSNLDIVAVDIGSGITKINSTAFAQCSNISSVTIADTVTRLGGYIFSGCTALTSVYIPDSVNEIAGGTFYRCSGLTEVTIGSGLTRFSNPFAFYYCTSLSSITCYATTAPILSGAGGTFSHLPSVGTLTVPYGSDYSSWVGTGATSYDTLASGWTISYMGDYSQEYLTLDILSGGTIVWTANNTSLNKLISYSLDNGGVWTSISSSNGGTTLNVNAGDKILLKGTNYKYTDSTTKWCTFSGSTAYFNIKGNIMSMVSGDTFADATTLINSQGRNFYHLFEGTNVVNTKDLVLPATGMTYLCYANMFKDCTSLVTSPYVLPAMTLDGACYANMFNGCTSLTTAPQLPATTLQNMCYEQMFQGCSSLTKAPLLPAETLPEQGYRYMFSGCTSLSSVTCLATNISANICTKDWLNGVAANGTFTKATSMTSWPSGTSGIPNGWTVVDAT